MENSKDTKATKDTTINLKRTGRKITATYLKGGIPMVKATAKCNPMDSFDYPFGANLAITRLLKAVATVNQEHQRIAKKMARKAQWSK